MKFHLKHTRTTLQTLLVALVLVAIPEIVFAQTTVVMFIWNFVNGFFGLLTALAGQWLDLSIREFVVNFGFNYTQNGIGNRVDTLWVTVRDIFNITFIFGLVYIGFKMILDSGNSQTRKWLVNLIIAALLVNFSLFITKFVVDISNQLATEIVCALPVPAGAPIGCASVEVSASLNNAMGITSIWRTGQPGGSSIPLTDEGEISGASFGYMFGAMLVFIVSAFVFAAGGFLLMIRYIVLHIYMILSPFLFIGMVFPFMANAARGHWEAFLKKAFVAPMYILMLYFAMHVLTGTSGMINAQVGQQTGASLGTTFSSAGPQSVASFENTIPPFLLGSGFLLAAVIVANKLGAEGAGAAINIGNNIRGRAQRRLRAGASAVGRGAFNQTGGRALREMNRTGAAHRRTLNNLTSNLSQTNFAGRAADQGRGRLRRAAARGVDAVSRATASTLDTTANAPLAAMENASIAGSETAKQKQDRLNQQQARFNTQANEGNRRNESAEDYAILNGNTATDEQRGEAEARLTRNTSRMSPDEVMTNFTEEMLRNPIIAQNLTTAHQTAIRDSGRFDNQTTRDIGDTRIDTMLDNATQAFSDNAASVENLTRDYERFGQTIRNFNPEERAGLGFNRLNTERAAIHLTDQHIEQLEQSGRFTPQQIIDIRTTRNNARMRFASNDGDITEDNMFAAADHQDQEQVTNFRNNRRRAMVSGNQRDVGRMPAAMFAEPGMREFVTPAAVAERMRNGVSEDERTAIQANIDAHLAGTDEENVSQEDLTRRANVWRNAARNGANSTFIQELDLQSLRDNPEPQQNNPGGGLIQPGDPNWNGGNAGPRPGPQ